MIENVEIVNIFECNVFERDGKHYANVTNVGCSMKYEDVFVKFKSDTTLPFVIKAINHIVNVNRKIIFAENEPTVKIFLSETARAFFRPIFSKFAIQDFFQENCE